MYIDMIKKSMRISHNALDDDIQNNIESALLDMRRIGIEPYLVIDDVIQMTEAGEYALKDMLVFKAIEFYCKWQADFEGMGERYGQRYQDFLSALSMSGKYIEV